MAQLPKKCRSNEWCVALRWLIAAIAVTGLTRVADAEPTARSIDLLVNGQSASGADETWPITPGCPNRLTVRARPELVSRGPCKVTLERIQPDGRHTQATATLTAEAPEATLELGLLAVPCQFDFEAGVLWRRACRFRLALADASGKILEQIGLFATTDATNRQEVLRVGDADRVVHVGWRKPEPNCPLTPPFLLQLDPEVLTNPDAVRVQCSVRGEKAVRGRLCVTQETTGRTMLEHEIELQQQPATVPLEVAAWPEGRYRIEFRPRIEGCADQDGPVIVYRRRALNQDRVRLSPLAPWELVRDRSREEVTVHDFRQAVADWSPAPPDPQHWQFQESKAGQVSLVTASGNGADPPVVLRPKLRGFYAVFAEPEGGFCYLRVGVHGLVRGVRGDVCFVEAADLTDAEIVVYPAAVPGSGLRRLCLVPVQAESVARLVQATRHPAVELRGVADWCDYFQTSPVAHGAGARLAEDQFETLLVGQRELGLRAICWSIGRSWVEYHSKLADASRFPCVPLESLSEKSRRVNLGRATMINQYEPLDYVLAHREADDLKIYPWLAMQRHYGNHYDGVFTSRWFNAHPEFHDWVKGADKPTPDRVCFFFPEVRKERVDILCEVAERCPDGLTVGCCRQPPMHLYHPQMVAEYQRQTGVDPRTIDAAQEDAYRQWISWRANWFTEVLRELQTRLGPIRQKTGRPIPVIVRVPSKGLFYNLAESLDVETWCREKLVDQIQLDPLEDCAGRGGNHDVRPYLALGRQYGLPIFGGVGGNTFWNPTAVLRRALGLLRAGVAGIELYESNNFAVVTPQRWLVPMLGNPSAIESFLEESNLEACWPLWSNNAASGYDNHSHLYSWSVDGLGADSL